MSEPARLILPNPFEALVPFAVVLGVVVGDEGGPELYERMLLPHTGDARAVMAEARKNAPRAFRGWACAADRPVPAWVYANSPAVFFEMARLARERQSAVVALDGVEADRISWPEKGGLLPFVWPLVARFDVPAGRAVPVLWPLSDSGRMALEEILLRRLNWPPGRLMLLNRVVHRSVVPGAVDAWVASALEQAGAEAIAGLDQVPVPVPRESYQAAGWPLFVPVGGVEMAGGGVTVVVPGRTAAAEEARRKLARAGWKARA